MSMKITILQRGGQKDHAAIERAARSYMGELLSTRMANTLRIRIELRSTKLPADTLAVVRHAARGSRPDKNFTIILDRDAALPSQLRSLAHECKHVEQLATNRYQVRRWSSDGQLHARWLGAELGSLSTLPYWTRPWEVEARAYAEAKIPTSALATTTESVL